MSTGGETTALCLSGGGYRAMLFHLGALWRLNEFGWLPRLRLISSVSGGSIAAGVLAKHWTTLAFDANGVAGNFKETVAADLLKLAGKTIDIWAVLRGLLSRESIGEQVARAYAKHLFDERTLQDLPDDPWFVINATSLQSGVLWRFAKDYMADYRVGQVLKPDTPLAVAVAASSAFPPFLSPLTLKLDPGSVVGFTTDPNPSLHHPPYTERAVLSDGGVYDNLGLQPANASQLVLVSDGGGHLKDEGRPRHLWPLQLLRVLHVMDSQVRALRSHQLISDLQAGRKRGRYWGIRTAIDRYGAPGALPAPHERTLKLAKTSTRLARLPKRRRQRLVNWGYAVTDAAMRSDGLAASPPAPSFPFPIGI